MTDLARQAYMAKVMDQLLADLAYPQGRDGSVIDANPFKALIAWHLTRAGWRKPNNTDGLALVEEYDDPVIKQRKVYGPGVFEDAVRWVGFNEPDDPLENLQDMSMAQIAQLPDDLQIEAKRRLGLIAQPEGDTQPAWSVQPLVQITDEPDLKGER